MEQEQLLKGLGGALKRLKIPYLITGGIAVVVWGRPRFTADIDIVVELHTKDVESLARELLKLDKEARVDKEEIREALYSEGEFNFFHPASGIKVDFWILHEEAFDRERLRRRIMKRVGGVPLYFSSPEDLILIKLLWHREGGSTRQLEDIESVLRIQKKLDVRYLKNWAKRQGTLVVLDSLLQKK